MYDRKEYYDAIGATAEAMNGEDNEALRAALARLLDELELRAHRESGKEAQLVQERLAVRPGGRKVPGGIR